MVIEALVALGIITVATVNTPDVKQTAEVKSVTSTVEPVKATKPKAKPKKKVVKKVAKVDPIKQQPSTNLVKSEPAKPESTTVSSPEQKTTQFNLLYYILGLLTLGLISAYFYYRNKGKNTDIKLHTSNELNKTLQEQTSSDSTQTSSEEIKK
jgi:outer membrane biosynthesis protein TonB